MKIYIIKNYHFVKKMEKKWNIYFARIVPKKKKYIVKYISLDDLKNIFPRMEYFTKSEDNYKLAHFKTTSCKKKVAASIKRIGFTAEKIGTVPFTDFEKEIRKQNPSKKFIDVFKNAPLPF